MSVLDTLEICFSANLGGVDAQLNALAGQLKDLSGVAAGSESALSSAGRQLATALGAGFAQALPALQAQAAAVASQTAPFFGSASTTAGTQGKNTATAFSSGISSGASGASAAARSVATGTRFDGGVSSAKSSGRALADGFAAGIRSGSSAVNAAVSAIVNSATRKIRSLLSIHSPSKVTRELGAYFGEGFAGGISGSVHAVEQAAGALSGAASDRLGTSSLPSEMALSEGTPHWIDDAIQRALGGVQLTIPLQVDGIKLGEASIRGINAVTRNAGRILLNL